MTIRVYDYFGRVANDVYNNTILYLV